MLKYFKVITISVLFFILPVTALANNDQADVYLFWAEGCPHCAVEKEFLAELVKQDAYKNKVEIHLYEVSEQGSLQALKMFAEKLDFSISSVPITVIDNWYVIGFNEASIASDIQSHIDAVLTLEGSRLPVSPNVGELPELETNKIDLPVIGTIDLKVWSLPAITIIMGLLDGFNPCAMWALLFLISLLLGMNDRKRMWILGSAFIVISSLVYFVFMAAWLNLIIFLGFIIWVRLLIGLVALFGGGVNLRKFWQNRKGGCEIGESEKRKETFAKLKNIVRQKQLWLALIGIAALAFTINLIELICSAGLPAVYTQLLVMNDLNIVQYYSYILMYIFFFMLDDLLIFFIAMITLRVTGISTKYSRWSSLIGGILMVIIGLLLIFKHEWLMFG